MSLSNTTENELALLLFNATTMADIAENDSTSPATTFEVGLHTADPGEAGTMSTSEATYTGYARESVARTSGGWTVSANNVSNTAAVTFGACTAGSETITHWSIGKAGGGATQIIVSDAVDSNLAVSSGITPSFAIGVLQVNVE